MKFSAFALAAVLTALVLLPCGASAASDAGTGVSVTTATLANGLKIVVLHDTLAPVVTTYLNFRAGSDDEPITGIAHAQEHMVYRDGAQLSGAQADEIAGFTGDEDNADTQNEVTQFFHEVPVQDLDVVLHLDAARFSGLLDRQADWNIERGAIEQEVTADNSDATYRLYVKMLHQLLGGTAYADEGLGTLHSFNTQINAPQIHAFANTWYHPNNATYVIAGDVDPATAIATVRALFGSMPAVALPPHHVGSLRPLAPASFSDRSDRSTTWIAVGYRFPGYDDPEYAASVVLADVLNSNRGPLAALVAEGKAIDAEADTSIYPKAAMIMLDGDVPTATAPSAAIADFKAVADRYRESGVPADLVEAAKAREVAKLQMASDSVQGLAQLWSETLAVERRTPQQDIDAIAHVSKADVDRVVAQWLRNDSASTAYAVPASGGAESSSGGGGDVAKPEQTTIAPLPPWAEAALARLQVPQQSDTPTAFTLANGLHVIVQPEHASKAVAVQGIVLHDNGLEEPTGQTGVATVTEKLLPYGTTTYGRVAYQTQLDAIEATDATGYAFSLAVPSANFDRGLQLLADDELHPSLRNEDLTVVRGEVAADLSGDEQNPDHLAAVAQANALFPPGDPARVFAKSADVNALTQADVQAFYDKTFRPDLTTIAIVGDVTPEEARASVERWFGEWKANGPPPAVTPPAVPSNTASQAGVPATGRIQDTTRMSETLNLSWDDDAIAPLRIANTMLSGDFSSILIRDLRVTTGYVYYVTSRLDVGKTRSLFVLRYGSSPENAGRAKALAVADLTRMQNAPLDSERLLRAKSNLLSAIPIGDESYDGLAKQLATTASEGLPLDEDVILARREFAATPQDVQSAMKEYVRPEGFVTIVEGPAPK
ncbi:MAG TPA: pitrilysin family protein [Candidatus Cybelea sp.]|jgi:zinc protease|nr:pitrilysin family protein [Candidatus Cybelea sp.]